MSYHSTILYYTHINAHIQSLLHPPTSASLILHSFNFASISPLLTSPSPTALLSQFTTAGLNLKASGAEGLAIGCNIGHRVAADLAAATGLPVLHIADAVAGTVRGVRKVGMLGTRSVMEEEFVKMPLMRGAGIEEVLVPGVEDRGKMDGVIFGELAGGKVSEGTRTWMNGMVDEMVERGAESIILACTDLQFVIKPERVRVPVYDTLELHAKYLAEWSIRE